MKKNYSSFHSTENQFTSNTISQINNKSLKGNLKARSKQLVLFVVLLFSVIGNGWGQVTIFSDGFNGVTNAISTTNFTGSGTAAYVGMSALPTSSATNCPASTNYFSEGTKAYHVRNGDITLTSGDIDTRCMNDLILSFKLAAFSNAANNGMDNGDFVQVSISPDGGANYYPTIRVRGYNNAKWLYSATGSPSTAYDGDVTLNSTVTSASGGNNCTTSVLSNGPSTVSITSLPNTSNMRIRIRLVSDHDDERWLIDDLKVTRTTINTPPSVSYSGSPFSYCVNSAILNLTPSISGTTSLSISPALPAGLSFNTSTGVISGTPTAVSSPTLYTINADAGASCTASTTISIGTKPSPSNANAGNDVSICAGGSTQLSGSATKTEVILLNEEFNNGFPTTWSRTSDVNTQWLLGPSEFDMVAEGYTEPATTTAGNGYMVANSDFWGGDWLFGSYGTDNSYLRTPTINCSGYDTVIFEMSHYYEYYGSPEFARLQVSIAGGSWATVYTWTGSTLNPENFSIVVPSAANQSDVRFRLRYYSDWSFYWVVDDIKVKGRISPISYSWSPTTALSSSNIFNPVASPASTITYTMTATSNGCSATDDVKVTVEVPTLASTLLNGDMVWRGATNTDWATLSNWWQYNGSAYVSATVAPTTAQNVIIPASQTCVLNQPNTFANSGNAKNLTIETGATLTMGNGTLVVNGNWVNNNVFVAGTGTVQFGGAVNTTIGGSAASNDFYNVTMNKTGEALLVAPATISSSLTLTNGNLNIAGYTIDMASNAINGGSAGSYVKTSGAGVLKRDVSGSLKTFPVGNGAYNPAGLTNIGTADKYGVRVIDNVTNDGTGVGTTTSDPVVKRTWMISETSPGGSDVSLQLYWNGVGEEINSFSLANTPYMAHYSTTWDNIGGTVTANVADKSGITSFSPFTIKSTISVLPIELISFQANCAGDKQVDVTWSTASEHNTSHFVVEKSRDGINWTILNTLGASGNSTTVIEYALTDNNVASGTTYYRLTQFDNDGVSETFNVASVNCGAQQAITSNLVTYPNPSNGSFYVDFYTQDITGPSLISVFDSRGVIIYRQDVLVEKGSNVFHIEDLEAAPGMYYIKVSNGTTTSYIVKHSLR